MNKHFFTYRQPLKLENGQTLQTLDVVYHTYGTINADKSNVVWFCPPPRGGGRRKAAALGALS